MERVILLVRSLLLLLQGHTHQGVSDVPDVKTGQVNIAVYMMRNKGKDHREGSCLGTCSLDVSSFYVAYGYHAPWDKWEVLLDPKNNQTSNCFVHLIAQLVPEGTSNLIRLLSLLTLGGRCGMLLRPRERNNPDSAQQETVSRAIWHTHHQE